MSLSLFSYVNDYRAVKVLATARAVDVKVDVPKFNYPEDLATPRFQKLSPFGKVPILVDGDDQAIFEPHAAIRLLARQNEKAGILGKSPADKSAVDQWMDLCSNELEPARDAWVFPLLGFSEGDADLLKEAKKDVFEALSHLENHLATQTYIAGEAVSAADIVWAAACVDLFRLVLVDGVRKNKFVNVTRWFDTIVNQPFFKDVVGAVEFATAEAKPKAVAASASSSKKGGNAQGSKKKNKGSKKKNKGGKKGGAAEAAPAQEAPKKKPVDPLTLLPKSSLDLDGIKRLFSNEPADVAVPQFWKEYDAEGWSLWLTEYKDVEDNKVDYMTSNLVGGWINRLESFRKWGFGVVNILGVEDSKGPFHIRGAWLVRGKELPLQVTDCPDFPSYTYSKVDASEGSATRKLWNDHFLQEETTGTLYGMPVYEKKYLK